MKINKICRSRVKFPFSWIFIFLAVFFKAKEEKGLLVKKFENKFADYIGIKHAVAVSSGKIALWLCLKALEAKEGDEIIVPAYTVCEVVDVIVSCGLVPVFVDISLKDGNIDAELIEDRISGKTKFFLMTHMHGCPCDIDEILKITDKYNLLIIEDAAQSCGAEYKKTKTGNFGKIAYYSFGFLKNLNTLSGGMIVTNDKDLNERIRAEIKGFANVSPLKLVKRLFVVCVMALLTQPAVFSFFVYPWLYLFRNKVQKSVDSILKVPRVDIVELEKLKVVFTAEQAAIGLKQIESLEERNDQRIRNAKTLNKLIKPCKNIKIFPENSKKKNIYLNYAIRTENRDLLIDNLLGRGVDVSPGMAVCCPDVNRFKAFFSDCPNSRKMQAENVYLPIYGLLKDKQIAHIANSIGCKK